MEHFLAQLAVDSNQHAALSSMQMCLETDAFSNALRATSFLIFQAQSSRVAAAENGKVPWPSAMVRNCSLKC